jgi:Na+/melibiose symporter-like transporter
MLDVSFFTNPRFTAASSSITLVFFALYGFSFLLTQYFQFVLGYSAAQTGVRQLPLAGALMVTAPLSARLVEKIGTKRVVASGLAIVTASLLLCLTLGASSSYALIAAILVILAVGMGLVMAPATESVMGSLPLAKAGVGSAVNDTTRQVGGALGVAVIGSVLSSVYGSKVVDLFNSHGAHAQAAGAKSGLGEALIAAARIGGATGRELTAGANSAFVSAMHGGSVVAAVASGVGIIVAAKFLPARARAKDVELQEHEYEDEMEAAMRSGETLEVVEAS